MLEFLVRLRKRMDGPQYIAALGI